MKRNARKWFLFCMTFALGLFVAGCPTADDSSSNNPPAPQEPPEEIGFYDVVIVGLGTSGHAAMAAAGDAVGSGGKVLVIEQLPNPSPMMSAGIAAADSTQQNAAQVAGTLGYTHVTKDTLFDTLLGYSHYTANAPLVRRIVDESGRALDWLGARGLLTTLQIGSDQGYHVAHNWLNTYHTHNSGWGALRDYFTTRGGEIRLNTRATDLVMAEDGVTVVGVLADDITDPLNPKRIKIGAGKVVLCCGGYGPATDKFKELLELENLQFYAFGGEGNLGAGIEMAVNTAGAKRWGDHSFMLHNNLYSHLVF
ncbi:hypothetical protein AGMMS4952_25110 [Spirochaetia bacterium]|nr:hypothetical protein AGMMS4952_25110 [Spirochaetia bacterium]